MYLADKTITEGIIHISIKHWLHKLRINVTLIDEKFNFCDFWVSVAHQFCPINPGKYYIHHETVFPMLFPSVSVNNEVSIHLIMMHDRYYYTYPYTIGPVLWQSCYLQ